MDNRITQVHHTSENELVKKILSGFEEKLNNLKNHFQPKEPTEWITRKEVATILSVSPVTVIDWSKKGILEEFRIGNQVRYKRKQVEQALTKINE